MYQYIVFVNAIQLFPMSFTEYQSIAPRKFASEVFTQFCIQHLKYHSLFDFRYHQTFLAINQINLPVSFHSVDTHKTVVTNVFFYYDVKSFRTSMPMKLFIETLRQYDFYIYFWYIKQKDKVSILDSTE